MRRWLAAVLAASLCLSAPIGCQIESQSGVMEDAASQRSQVVEKQAPPFRLMDQSDKPVSLADLKGKWVVLYFYPKDDTPGCACQATEFTKALTDFRSMNATVYGISTDSTASHRLFIDKYHLEIDLLSDPDHAVMRKYGAWAETSLGDENYGRVIRTTLIIDPEGKIRRHWPEVIPEGHAQRVRNHLAALQAGA